LWATTTKRCPWAMSFFLFTALVVLGVIILGVGVFLVARRWL
jgi:hypothetical protein